MQLLARTRSGRTTKHVVGVEGEGVVADQSRDMSLGSVFDAVKDTSEKIKSVRKQLQTMLGCFVFRHTCEGSRSAGAFTRTVPRNLSVISRGPPKMWTNCWLRRLCETARTDCCPLYRAEITPINSFIHLNGLLEAHAP